MGELTRPRKLRPSSLSPMSENIQWNAAAVFATILAVACFGATAAGLTGHVTVLLPVEIFGKPTPISGAMLAIQCFSIGMLLLCSVYNNYARSQLGFHALGLIPALIFAYSAGFTENIVQNAIIAALCTYFAVFDNTSTGAKATAASGTVATILMSNNLVILLLFCASPLVTTADVLFPQFAGQRNANTFLCACGSAFVYVLPMAGAVLSNRASQVQPWWAICLFFNTAMHMMMDPVDTANAIPNGVLGVLHMTSALFCSSQNTKARSD